MPKHRLSEQGVRLRLAYEKAVRGDKPNHEAAAAIRAEAQQEGAGLAAREAVVRNEHLDKGLDYPEVP